jgi:hypothetical protein
VTQPLHLSSEKLFSIFAFNNGSTRRTALPRGEIFINPPGKDSPLDLHSLEKLIVIARPRSFEGFV